jgi:hypothetical protein
LNQTSEYRAHATGDKTVISDRVDQFSDFITGDCLHPIGHIFHTDQKQSEASNNGNND